MEEGRVSEITYKRSVLKQLTNKDNGTRPGVEAASIILEDVTLVMSSNCVLKYFSGCEDYYVQKTINGIYEQCGEPLSIQLEINIPKDYEEKLLGKTVKRFDNAAKRRGLDISSCKVYAGKVSDAISHITVVGKSSRMMNYNDVTSGMDVVMANSIGIGGTAVLSRMYEDILSNKFSAAFVRDCLELGEHLNIKVIKDIAEHNGAVLMHTISDSGTFGGIWEIASSINKGITVNVKNIPVWQNVIEVAEVLDVNPYLVDGTGAMLIVTEDGEGMVTALEQEGITANIIGYITDSNDRVAINGDEKRFLEPPRGNELYKAWDRLRGEAHSLN